MTSDDLSLLRHTVATLAYRGGKAVRHAPGEFAAFKAGPTTRTPVEILAHVGDLLDWALGLADGRYEWHDSTPLPWEQEVDRFFGGLKKLDDRLASGAALGFPPEKVFQGPIADALTHVGQIAMLRRMAGHPMRGENYFQADIMKGRVGLEQSAPRKEFD
jgi:hypothetical protein